MRTSERIEALAAALSKAQGAMRPAKKDAVNPHLKNKYADLAANVEAAREALAANGLAVVQEPVLAGTAGGGLGVSVSTRLLHSSGQWIEFDPLTVPAQKSDAHGIGSATTYARRYALGAALGLVAEDDDAAGAVGGGKASEPAKLSAPAGFDVWLDDLAAVADNGLDQLRATWTASKDSYRRHLMATNPAGWEALKERAGKVKTAEPAGVSQ